MKFFLLVIVLIITPCSFSAAQDNYLSGLNNAYNSWKRNKQLLDKSLTNHSNKVEECRTLKRTNESRIAQLKIEKERVKQELLSGSFCSQCKRSKSEIETAENIPFLQHLRNVSGTQIPATRDVIEKRMNEFDDKIQQLGSAINECDVDVFKLEGEIRIHTAYVESNIRSANQSVNAINSYLNRELTMVINEMSNQVSELNVYVSGVNNELAYLNRANDSKGNNASPEIDNKLNTLIQQAGSVLVDKKSKFKGFSGRSVTLYDSYNSNKNNVSKIVAEMQLNNSMSVNINILPTRVIYKISNMLRNSSFKDKVGNSILNLNNELNTCQTSVDDILNLKMR